ncbi:MAG: hypothetical protein HYU75_16760 [Betaproteobacteria bacterium]|nr:hypothetical protein [Betaproteobacteria bacterium]
MDPGLGELLPPKSAPEGNVMARAKATEAFYKKGDLAGGLEYYFDGGNGAGAWKRLPEAQRQIRLENAWTVIGQAADENAKPISCADIGRLRIPVLLMTGQNGPRRFGLIMDAYQKCQPSAERVTIPNAAHQMSQMNPPAVDAALTRFFLE